MRFLKMFVSHKASAESLHEDDEQRAAKLSQWGFSTFREVRC